MSVLAEGQLVPEPACTCMNLQLPDRCPAYSTSLPSRLYVVVVGAKQLKYIVGLLQCTYVTFIIK